MFKHLALIVWSSVTDTRIVVAAAGEYNFEVLDYWSLY